MNLEDMEGAPEEEDLNDLKEYHYFNYFFQVVREKETRPQHYIMFHNFYDHLMDPKTYIEDKSFLSKLNSENRIEIISILFETMFNFNRDINEDAYLYSYLILQWFYKRFTPKNLPFIYDSSIGNLIFDSTKKLKTNNYPIESIQRGLSMLEIFIRNGGEIKLAISVIYFNFYLTLSNDFFNAGNIDSYFPNLITLLGAFILKFFKNLGEEEFAVAVSISSQIIENSQETRESAMRFWLDCIICLGCNFLEYLNDNGFLAFISGFLLHDGSVEFQKNLFDFISIIIENATQQEYENLFLPFIDWSQFSNVFQSDPFDALSFCDCIDKILHKHPELITTFFDSGIIQLLLNIINQDDRFSIQERITSLLDLLSFNEIMSIEMELFILTNGIENSLLDLIELMQNSQLNSLIHSLIQILEQFQIQGNEFQSEISNRWRDLGLFDLFAFAWMRNRYLDPKFKLNNLFPTQEAQNPQEKAEASVDSTSINSDNQTSQQS